MKGRWTTAVVIVLCSTAAMFWGCSDKTTSDPTSRIDALTIPSTLYGEAAYLDTVTVVIATAGVLPNAKVCWLGVWNLSQGYQSQPVWYNHGYYNQSDMMVFYPFVTTEGTFGMKAGLCVYNTDVYVDSLAFDLEGPVTIWVGASYWPRKMEIEYDCQVSYSTIRTGTIGRLNAAFNPCSTAVKIVKSDTALANMSFPSYGKVVEFVTTHWSAGTYKMYLAGIMDQSPREQGFEHTFAITLGPAFGEPYGASVIYRRCIDSTFSNPPYWWDAAALTRVTDWITAHELGHQRAGLTHADSVTHHVAGFPCAMLPGVPVSGNAFNTQYERFCDSCVTRIKRVSW